MFSVILTTEGSEGIKRGGVCLVKECVIIASSLFFSFFFFQECRMSRPVELRKGEWGQTRVKVFGVGVPKMFFFFLLLLSSRDGDARGRRRGRSRSRGRSLLHPPQLRRRAQDPRGRHRGPEAVVDVAYGDAGARRDEGREQRGDPLERGAVPEDLIFFSFFFFREFFSRWFFLAPRQR